MLDNENEFSTPQQPADNGNAEPTVEETTEKAIEETSNEPIEEHAEETAEETAEGIVEEIAEEAAEEVTENTFEEPTQEASKESAEENITYHFSYQQAESPNYSEPQPNTYYTPPQQDTYYTPPTQTAEHTAPVNGKPISSQQYAAPKKKNKTLTVLISVFAACIILAVVGLFISGISDVAVIPEDESTTNPPQEVEVQPQNTPQAAQTDGTLTVREVTEKCIDSCVGITVYTKRTNYNNFYGFGSGSSGTSEEVVSGEGSGILMLESNGKTYIMTCAHVISDGTGFVITLNDGTEYRATMVGYDAQTDIGVLSINVTGLKIAEFANSDETAQGEQVVAIGCPGGLQFLNSTTVGYVSALGRPISSSIGYNTECIQIDAAINPGNSGGALFNMSGQVIGVNSSKIAATEYEGMGFAIPSNTAVNTANSLIRVGYVEGRAKLGITYKSITSYSNSDAILNALAQLGYENASGTMVINEIASDSDLANKDVKAYDMIVAINGKTLTSTDIMTSVLSSSKPGDTVTLTVARIQNNQIDTFEVECTLVENRG